MDGPGREVTALGQQRDRRTTRMTGFTTSARYPPTHCCGRIERGEYFAHRRQTAAAASDSQEFHTLPRIFAQARTGVRRGGSERRVHVWCVESGGKTPTTVMMSFQYSVYGNN
eukprot:91611-Rhodomonas_salina.1